MFGAVAICTASLGCQPEQDGESTRELSLGISPAAANPTPKESPTPKEHPTPATGEAPGTSDEGPIKKPLYPRGKTYKAEIDWDAASAYKPKLDASTLSTEDHDKLSKAQMPVLLPSDNALLEKVTHYSVREHGYSASLAPQGHHIYVAGIRTVHEYPQIELDEAGDKLLEQPYRISRTHQIVTLSFSRFGVGYTIDVECAKPMDDTRCTEDGYIEKLYESLALLDTRGGTP